MFLALHLQLCIFDSAYRCEAVCIARPSPSGHTCAEGNSTVPSSSSIWHQLPVTSQPFFSIHLPFPWPPHTPAQALAWAGSTHPLLLKPLFPLEGLPRQTGIVCPCERPPLVLWDGTTPAFHQAFQCRNQAKSGFIPSHGCQDHIEKHLAGRVEALGSAVQEIYFQL